MTTTKWSAVAVADAADALYDGRPVDDQELQAAAMDRIRWYVEVNYPDHIARTRNARSLHRLRRELARWEQVLA